MLHNAKKHAILLILTSAICIGAAAANRQISEALLGNDPQAQRIALGTIRQQHSDNVKSLVRFVGQGGVDDTWEGPRHLAIRLLGDIRATEAIPVLSKRLTFMPTGVVETEMLPREYYYPCAVALVNIGAPCVGAMIDTISWNEDKTTRDLAAWVVMKVEGKEEAANHLQDLAAKSYDKKHKPRLQAAQDFVANYVPDFTSPGGKPDPNLIPRQSKSQK